MGDEPAANKRPVIQLPSLQQVQAAQRLGTAAPRFFRPAAAAAAPSSDDHAAAASTSTTQQQQQPADLRQGLGVFSPVQRQQPPQQQQQWQPPAPRAAPPPTTIMYSRPPQQQQSQQQVNPNAIQVSRRQEGNALLKHLRNVRWQYADIVPDYQMGAQHAALFLSLRYHLLKPAYIHGRIKELQRAFRLRLLLCHVDVEDVVAPLAALNRIALTNECTLICAWSPEECARYLETYKAYEAKPADLIQGRSEEDYLSKLNAALTSVRGVNRTDVLTLAGAFRSAAGVFRADAAALAALPGIGPTKVRRLAETFHEPFRKTLRQSRLQLVPVERPLADAVLAGGEAVEEEEDDDLA